MMEDPGNRISIRQAQPADAAALADLSAQLGYPVAMETIAARLARVHEEQAGEVLVAVDGQGSVIGWTHVAPRVNLEEAAFAELAGLVVADTARSAGVGRVLLHAAEDWARSSGFAKLRVRSNIVRERAHAFYLREGYVERKRQAVFDKPL